MIKKTLKDFSAGMWVQPDGTAIPDNACIELINMRLSEKGYPTSRFGSKKINTTTMSASYKCRGVFVNEAAATDGKMYIYIPCGGYLYYSNGGEFTKLAISGTDIQFTETAEWDGFFWNGLGYFANGLYPIQTAPTAATSTAIKIDGTTCTNLTYADSNSFPKNIDKLTMFNRRVYANPANSNIVYVSVQDDPEDWYDGTNDLYTYFGYEDGEDITGIHEMRDGIAVVKPTNIYRWFCRGDFKRWEQRKITGEHNDYGCHWHRSIAPFTYRGRAGLAWMGWNGVIHFDGDNCREMSAPIRSIAQNLPQTKPTKSVWKVDTQDEWEGGEEGSNQIDTRGGEITQLPQTTSEDFAAGTDSSTEAATQITGDGEQNSYVRHSYIIDDFRDGELTNWTEGTGSDWGIYPDKNYAWLYPASITGGETITHVTNSSQSLVLSGIRHTISPTSNEGYWGFVADVEPMNATVFFSNGNALSSGGYLFTITNSSVACHKISSSLYTEQFKVYIDYSLIKSVQIRRVNSSNTWSVSIDGSAVSGASFSDSTYTTFTRMIFYGYYSATYPFGTNVVSRGAKISNVWYHATDPTPTGTFTSQTIDYSADVASNFDYGNLLASLVSDGTTVTFETYTSDTSDFSSGNDTDWLSVGTAGENRGKIKSAAKRYLRWRVNFSITTGGQNPRVLGVKVGGQYISDNKDLGSVPTDVGALNVTQDIPQGTSAEWYVETAATEGGLDGTGWVKVSPGEPLNINTFFGSSEDWIRFKVILNSYGGFAKSPIVDRVTFDYYVGDRSGTPAAVNWHGRYHLSVDRKGSGKNDAVLVCNENGAWAQDIGLNISAWATTKNRLITGSSTEGFARWTYDGRSDDGGLIFYALTTKDDYGQGSPERYEDQDKCFRKIYPVYKSKIPIMVTSYLPGEPGKEKVFDISDVMRTQRADLDGMNTGQYIRYRITPNAYNFQEDPGWPTLNSVDYAEWNEDEYIYFKADQTTTTTRRYYKMLDRVYDQDDDFAAWFKIESTTLASASEVSIGFFNTSELDNETNCAIMSYIHSAGSYFNSYIYNDAGSANAGTYVNQAFSNGSEYYVNLQYRGTPRTLTATLYDSDLGYIGESIATLTATRVFEVDAFGLLNPTWQDTAVTSEWKLLECMPYYNPNDFSGIGVDADFEFMGLSHEFIPLQRID